MKTRVRPPPPRDDNDNDATMQQRGCVVLTYLVQPSTCNDPSGLPSSRPHPPPPSAHWQDDDDGTSPRPSTRQRYRTLVSPSPSVPPRTTTTAPRSRAVLTYRAIRTHTVSATLTSTPSTHPPHASSRIHTLVPVGSPASCVRERTSTLPLPSHERPHPHAASPSPPSPLRAISPTLGRLQTFTLPLVLPRLLLLFAPPRSPWHVCPIANPRPRPLLPFVSHLLVVVRKNTHMHAHAPL